MSFAFEVSDLKTGKRLGGGLYPELSDEGAFVAANEEFQRIYPNREIHVEEINVEQYLKEGGTDLEAIKDAYSDKRRSEIVDE